MLAVKALYDNGSIQWLGKPPVQRAEIIVVFTSERETKKPANDEMSTGGFVLSGNRTWIERKGIEVVDNFISVFQYPLT